MEGEKAFVIVDSINKHTLVMKSIRYATTTHASEQRAA
jgi:hypothetical protein